ncbi:MAG: hypothetical protein FJ356_00655 [Thaumarchaeota archaeon]|nr:hypothetical protein [Nitrososphaerota archaeon]
MNNVVQYSLGFLDGIKKGKRVFLGNLGEGAKKILEAFIDANARSNPQMLHHVYEWSRVGSPDARLFDINYTVSNLGLSFSSSFRQSNSIKQGSSVPFYNKAKIMEEGIPVVITPKRSTVLAFEQNGETVFTKSPVEVLNPGGAQVQGSFERTVDLFFSRYFTQAFLRTSGVAEYFKNPVLYKRNLQKGKSGGRQVGISTGYSWITNVGARTNG